MSREFPDWINPWKAAEGNRIFSGTIPLARLERLGPLLAGTEGEARFQASFSLDRQKRAVVDIEVEADLPLICQVSLEEYRHAISRKSRLVVVESEREQELLPEEVEATSTEEGRLGFEALVEDELLLALPQIPRKPDLQELQFSTDEEPAAAEQKSDTYKPFAGLEKMLHGGRTDRNSGKD